MPNLATKIVQTLIEAKPTSREEIAKIKRGIAGAVRVAPPPSSVLIHAYRELVKEQKIERDEHLEVLLQKRSIRSQSGLSPITVLTKPYPCPGKCTYCPEEVRMPKSYLAREPAAARALKNHFDPYLQVHSRLSALYHNGHTPDKVDLIVKGGTWSSYPPHYQSWFLRRCLDAMNEFTTIVPERSRRPAEEEKIGIPLRQAQGVSADEDPSATPLPIEERKQRTAEEDEKLVAAQQTNETAPIRCIGLTIETRPDSITPRELTRLRLLGCTRVEMGVQTTDDRVNELTKRGHTTDMVKRATKLLKDAGFKTDYHMMQQLPGATPESDIQSIRDIFDDPAYRPDMIKIYPCVVIKGTELYTSWKNGTYIPYSDEKLLEVLVTIKTLIPRYVRISRLIRDFPGTYIIAGNLVTNLRQTVQSVMRKRGLACKCLRCREIGHQQKNFQFLISNFQTNHKSKILNPKLFVDEYEASGGKEYFLSFEDEGRTVVYAFCRLRIPSSQPNAFFPSINDIALLRELHTYGTITPVGMEANEKRGDVQHTGLGKRLMNEAEAIARRHKRKTMAVISGVGVRGYYRNLGYTLEGTYMTKTFDREHGTCDSSHI